MGGNQKKESQKSKSAMREFPLAVFRSKTTVKIITVGEIRYFFRTGLERKESPENRKTPKKKKSKSCEFEIGVRRHSQCFRNFRQGGNEEN